MPKRTDATFGACNNDPGHGHSYMLEVTVAERLISEPAWS